MCLSTAFQSIPTSCATCSLSFGTSRALRSLILVAPPFIFMKSSKTSDSKPTSLQRALTLPLQIHAPTTKIQQAGATKSEERCAAPITSCDLSTEVEREERPDCMLPN